MRMIRDFLAEVKEGLVLVLGLLAGGRHCYHCSHWSDSPITEWEHEFCSRACAGAWRKLLRDRATIEQQARNAGVGA